MQISGVYGRLTPPLGDGGASRLPFPSSAGLPGLDGAHREASVRIPGLSSFEDDDFYGIGQQQRMSPVKRAPVPGAMLNDGNSQATSSSLQSIRSEGLARGPSARDHEEWLVREKEIDDLKRQLREKEENRYARHKTPSVKDMHPSRPLSSRYAVVKK